MGGRGRREQRQLWLRVELMRAKQEVTKAATTIVDSAVVAGAAVVIVVLGLWVVRVAGLLLLGFGGGGSGRCGGFGN